MYDNAGNVETAQEPLAMPDDVSEQQKQEWREELEKVSKSSSTMRYFGTYCISKPNNSPEPGP